MDATLSGWEVRQRLTNDGYFVSDDQLDSFEAWGLITRAPDGRWPPPTVGLVAKVLEAATDARLLARRVLRLRADFAIFPIAGAHVRQAMLEAVPTVKRPVRNLNRVARALEVLGQRYAGAPARRRRKQRLIRPRHAEWRTVLERVSPLEFDARATGWYALAQSVLPDLVRGTSNSIDDIPIEDRVVALAVLDVANPVGAPPAIRS